MDSSKRKNSLIKRLKEIKINAKLGPKSLQGQLILSVWLGLAVVLIPINTINTIRTRETATQLTRKTLEEQASFVYFGVVKWRQSISELLNLLAFAPQIRQLDATNTSQIFDRLDVLFPNRSWRLWNREGELLVANKIMEPASRDAALSKKFFQESIRGKRSHGIYKKCLSLKPCFIESVPVYAPGVSSFATNSPIPVGVLNIAINLEDTGKDNGLANIYGEINSMMTANQAPNVNASWKNGLSLQNGDYSGLEVMMVSNQGDVIFPITTVNDSVSMQSREKIAEGPWGPFVKLGQVATMKGKFQKVSSINQEFYAYSQRIDNEWNLVAISDKAASDRAVLEQIINQVVTQLLTMVGVTIMIVIACRKTAKPIQLAGKTIKEFSTGNFEARITTDRADEIGELFNNINTTGANLRDLMNDQLAHAVTDQQVKTAMNIQKSFIVETLPINRDVELAGDFDPAYDIGADWYDALTLDNITYLVIADVCDKGIASALFMSVFRSLTRYSIIDEHREMKEQGLKNSLVDTIKQVNDYMASNHENSSMFATLFLGAYDRENQRLSYVCAGHEKPLIIRNKGVLEELETTGPAIGIFCGATYNVKTVDLLRGQILFTYTDGLVDLRSPENISFGIEGVKKALHSVDPKSTTAHDLLTFIKTESENHRKNAEQFDDLTILVMKINEE